MSRVEGCVSFLGASLFFVLDSLPKLKDLAFLKNQLAQQRVEDEVNSGSQRKVCLLPTTTTPSLLGFIIQYAFEWMVDLFSNLLFIEFLFFVTPKEHFPINGS